MRCERNFYLLLLLSNLMLLTGTAFVTFAQTSDQNKQQQDKFEFSLSLENKDKNRDGTDAAQDDEIRIETTLVVNEILVFDENKQPVENLKREDFVVIEDGVSQEIEAFSFAGEEKFSRSIVLIIDHSVSQLPYLQTSIEAAKSLVDRLEPDDRMAIVTDDVELLQTFTADKTLLKEKLELLKSKVLAGKLGKSRQYSALQAVLKELSANNNLRPIIIFQTDGDQLSLLKGEDHLNVSLSETLDFGLEDILTETEKNRAVIHTIIPEIKFVEIPENERLSRARTHFVNTEKTFAEMRKSKFVQEKLKPTEKMLKQRWECLFRQQSAMLRIAKYTGGWTYFLEQPEQAENIYKEILSNMKRRYILGYYPTNQSRDGKKRQIKTEVRGFPRYTVWSRESYMFGNNGN